jgi:Mg2+ and Co2+ transporter CorA
MISKYSHKGLNWIDLESLSNESEIDHIIEQLSIPSHIEEKIKMKEGGEALHIDDDFIVVNIGNKMIFVVCDKYVLSIHDRPIQAFSEFSKEMEQDIIIEEKSKINNNILLFAHLVKNLYLNSEIQAVGKETEIKILKKALIQKSKKLKLFIFLSILLLATTIIFICL